MVVPTQQCPKPLILNHAQNHSPSNFQRTQTISTELKLRWKIYIYIIYKTRSSKCVNHENILPSARRGLPGIVWLELSSKEEYVWYESTPTQNQLGFRSLKTNVCFHYWHRVQISVGQQDESSSRKVSFFFKTRWKIWDWRKIVMMKMMI